jgi:hypothetical protein
VNRSGDHTATSSTCTAVDELQSGEENLRMLGRRSCLPGAGARRRAWERLERLDPADAAAGGSAACPTESFGIQDTFGRALVPAEAPVCGQRGMQTTAT